MMKGFRFLATLPPPRAPEAYARMMAGEARFRIVLTMDRSA